MDVSLITQDEQIESQLQHWGFPAELAPESLKRQAKNVIELSRLKAGELVVALGLSPAQDVRTLLEVKPNNILTLEYLATHIPGLRDQLSKVMATLKGLPYLDQIPDSSEHPQSTEPLIRKRCDILNATLIKTPSGHPMLLFSDYTRLFEYAQEGREDRATDPIRQMLKVDDPILALGSSSQILKSAGSAMDKADKIVNASAQDNYWAGNTAKTEAERILARILDNAIIRNATDIDFSPKRDGTSLVRLRVFGDMAPPDRHAVLDVDTAQEITRFLLSRSRAGDGSRLRNPADGQIFYKGVNSEVFLRCSFIPADRFGLEFDMIATSLRLLPRMARAVYMSDLGLAELVQTETTKALARSQGLIVLAGPTNSGKSTTIAGIVGEHLKMFGDAKKRLSIEDPVERYLNGITQISVQDNFAELIRQMLRHDPDLVWVGEIRDNFSAAACVRAATSGHIVLSTVHANDSILAFRAIGNYLKSQTSEEHGATASQFDLAESLSLIISQRLVKKLCPVCKIPHVVSDEEKDRVMEYMDREGLALNEDLEAKTLAVLSSTIYKVNPLGCATCANTGYGGELPICEILPATREVRDVLTENEHKLDYGKIAKYRLNTLFSAALDRVSEGDAELGTILV